MSEKLVIILFLVPIIYLWNKYIVTFSIRFLINFHKKYNKQNLNKVPIKFLIKYEKQTTKAIQVFYSFGAVVIIILLINLL